MSCVEGISILPSPESDETDKLGLHVKIHKSIEPESVEELCLYPFFESINQEQLVNELPEAEDRIKSLSFILRCVSFFNETANQIFRLGMRIYGYQGIFRLMPPGWDKKMEPEIRQAAIELYEPQVKLIIEHEKNAMSLIKKVAECIKEVSKVLQENKEPPVILLNALCEVFTALETLCSIKRLNVGMCSDVSMYKRLCKASGDTTFLYDIESKHMCLFLSNSNTLVMKLADKIRSVARIRKIIACVIDHCIHNILVTETSVKSRKSLLLPALLVSLNIIVYLGEQYPESRVFKDVRLKKVLKMYPITCLFSDLHLYVSNTCSKISPLKQLLLEEKNENKTSAYVARSSILNTIDQDLETFRRLHSKLLQDVIPIINRINGRKRHISRIEAQITYKHWSTAIEFIVYLSEKLSDNMSAKFLSPNERGVLNPTENIRDVSSYELIYRFNLSATEKKAILKYIEMIRTISVLILHDWHHLFGILKCYLTYELSRFLNKAYPNLIYLAIKKKKESMKTYLQFTKAILESSIYNTSDSSESEDQKCLLVIIGDKDGSMESSYPVQLNFSNLSLVSIIMESALIDDILKYKNHIPSEVRNEVVELSTNFSKLNYELETIWSTRDIIKKVSNFSQLWFKEIYCMFDKDQSLPFEASMPFILVDYVVRELYSGNIENLWLPLGIYNDAAEVALSSLKSQVIYNKIVEESKYALEHMVINIAIWIYEKSAEAASITQLPQQYISKINAKSQFEIDMLDDIFSRGNYMFLGTYIDIASLVGTQLNIHIKRRMAGILMQLSKCSISNIHFYCCALNIIRECHFELSTKFILQSYNTLFSSVNLEDGQPHSKLCGIITNLMKVIVEDYYTDASATVFKLFLSESLNSTARDQKCGIAADIVELKMLAKSFEHMVSRSSGIVTYRHIDQILKICSLADMLDICEGVLNISIEYVQKLITSFIIPIRASCTKIPKNPLLEYGSTASYYYFLAHFNTLRTQVDIDEALILLRRLGNTVALMCLLGNSIEKFGYQDDIQRKFLKESNIIQKLQEAFTTLGLDEDGEYSKCSIINEIAATSSYYNSVSIFHRYLHLLKIIFKEKISDNEALKMSTNTTLLSSIWSVMQFLICLHLSVSDKKIKEKYGESISWAGTILIWLFEEVRGFQNNDFLYHIIKSYNRERSHPLKQSAPRINSVNQASSSSSSKRKSIDDKFYVSTVSEKGSLDNFIQNAAYIKDSNGKIFEILKASFKL